MLQNREPGDFHPALKSMMSAPALPLPVRARGEVELVRAALGADDDVFGVGAAVEREGRGGLADKRSFVELRLDLHELGVQRRDVPAWTVSISLIKAGALACPSHG